MGVDCKIYLPANCSISNVAKVIGAVAGCPMTRESLGGSHKDSISTRFENLEVRGNVDIPQLANIYIRHKTIDGIDNHFVNYHFECSNTDGLRLLMPRSTAFWLAVAHRLVDFFGGRIDYQDCDDTNNDYEVPGKSWNENSPQDGEEWQNFQNRVFAITPITVEEWQSYDKDAAYKISEM